jgi:acetolactate synthase-1/2/3 large subunit
MSQITGGEAVVESLIANGIETVFGLPGAQLDPIFAALHDRTDRIRIIHSRHEQGAAYMAYGFAEVSGSIGTLLVVPGPGLLNAGAAIVTGYACNTPMLCLVGQGRSHLVSKGFGILHEIPDQFQTAQGLVKWAGAVTTAAEIPARLAEAINQIRHLRPRPVYVELPFDLTKAVSEIPDPVLVAREPVTPEINPDDVDAAAQHLAAARCPLIIAGGGATMAGEQIRELAELLNAPVAMTQNGLGTIDSRHELAFTPLGAHHWWRQADVVLAIGTRLFPAATAWGRDDAMRIIKVDIDDAELHRLPAPIDGIHGDAAEVAEMLRDAVDTKLSKAAPDRSDAIATVRAAVGKELESVAPQRELLDVIRDQLGEDGVLVSDLTQLYFAAQDVFPVYSPRSYVQASYQGTLGHCAATCLGAQVAAGDRPVIGLAGDGGFMFTMPELATAMQYDIPATFLVMNDGAFGNVKRILEEDYGDRAICADLQNPDFVKLAESFGMPARRASSPRDLAVALRESIAERGPTLVEYQAPEFPSPWPLHFRNKVRGS